MESVVSLLVFDHGSKYVYKETNKDKWKNQISLRHICPIGQSNQVKITYSTCIINGPNIISPVRAKTEVLLRSFVELPRTCRVS